MGLKLSTATHKWGCGSRPETPIEALKPAEQASESLLRAALAAAHQEGNKCRHRKFERKGQSWRPSLDGAENGEREREALGKLTH